MSDQEYALRPFVGVDVVDLDATRTTGRGSDERFLNRVFSPGERARIEAAVDRDLEVWSLWAAKEAAFKVISKELAGPPVFHHARFEVVDDPGTPIRTLRWEDHQIALDLAKCGSRLLAWGWSGVTTEIFVGHADTEQVLSRLGLTPDLDSWLDGQFSADEQDAIHGLPSALVRLAAREDAARLLGPTLGDLRIVCPPGPTGLRPPYLVAGNEPVERADISLSHDGRWIAWAIRLDASTLEEDPSVHD